MYALLVRLHVKTEFRQRFMDEMLLDARGSVENEPGCLRFDVIRDENDPNVIYLYEVYKDPNAFRAHSEAPHFIRWRDTTKDWLAEETVVWRGFTVFPPAEAWQKQTL